MSNKFNQKDVQSTPQRRSNNSFTGDILSTHVGLVPSAVTVQLTSDYVEKFLFDLLHECGVSGNDGPQSLQIVTEWNRSIKANTMQAILIFDGDSKHVSRSGGHDDLISILNQGGKVRFSHSLNNAIGGLLTNANPQFVEVKDGNRRRKMCFIPISIDYLVSLMLNIDGVSYQLAFANVETKKVDRDRQMVTFEATKYMASRNKKKKKSSGSREMQNAINQYMARMNNRGR